MKELGMILFKNKTDRESMQMNIDIDTDLNDRIDKIKNTMQLCLDDYVSKGMIISDLIRVGLASKDTVVIDSSLYSYSDFENSYDRLKAKIENILASKLDTRYKVLDVLTKLNLDIDRLTTDDYTELIEFILKEELSKDSELRIINLKYIDDIFPVTDYLYKIFEYYKEIIKRGDV